MLEQLPLGVVLCRPVLDDGRRLDFLIQEANGAAARLIGAGRELLTGRRALEAVPGLRANPTRWRELLEVVSLTGEPARGEELDSRSGRWLRLSASCPEAGLLTVLLEDVTREKHQQEAARGRAKRDQVAAAGERKRAEQALRASAAREHARAAELQAVMDSVPAAVWISHDGRGELITGNRYSYELIRLPPTANASFLATEAMRRSRFRACVNGCPVPDDQLPVRRAARGEEIRNAELELVFEDGTTRYLLGNATPLRDESGHPCGSVAAFMDIGDRKAAENVLREADRRKDEFLAMLSHELRNPLAPIRNSVHLLDQAPPGGAQARRAVAVIERQVGHITRLIEDLLDLTRISRGKVRLQRQPVELGELARRVVEDHRSVFTERGVELEWLPAAQGPWVDGDPTRLAQVLGNLLQNAVKFTERGGRVTVSAKAASGGSAELSVRDDGVGIAPELLTRIFEQFVQADRTVERSSSGLGLGLALVKGLVELHGGVVEAHSQGVGQGCELVVRLPRTAEPTVEARPVQTAPRGGRRRVLIIEDNSDAADSLREALEFAGHRVEVAPGGAEGLGKAREFLPEVVLCDIGLPSMNGYEVARAFRRDPTLQHMFLVALSGYAAPEDIENATRAGFDGHLAKPPDFDDVERAIAAAPPFRAPRA